MWKGKPTRVLSFAHGPNGNTSLSSTTSVNPASLSHFSNFGPGHGSIPLSWVPSMNRSAALSIDESFFNDPSGEVQCKSTSWNSTQPPGLRFLWEEISKSPRERSFGDVSDSKDVIMGSRGYTYS